jgi:hypothetical protein
MPEQKFGLFVSYNTDTGIIRDQLLKAFLDRYFPAGPAAAQGDKTKPAGEAPPKASLERFAGQYASTRYSHTTPTKLGRLFSVLNVAVDDGELVVTGLGEDPRRFVQIEPRLFRQIDDPGTLAFRENDQGQVTYLLLGQTPIVAFEKLAWHQTQEFVLILLAVCAALFVSSVVGWPWAAFILWGVPRLSTSGSRFASAMAWIMSLAALAWFASVVLLVGDPGELVFGLSPAVEWLLWAAPVLAALVAVVVLCTLVAWLRGYWRFSGRLHYTLVAAAGVAFVGFLHHWNLLQLAA